MAAAKIWHECDRLKSGAVNQIHIFTKWKFAKELCRHCSALKLETVMKIMDNPNLIWNLRAKPAEYNNSISSAIGEKEWVDYFSVEFEAPDESKNQMFCEQLSPLLTEELNYFVVNSSHIREVCKKFKKKSSSGADKICAHHLLNGSPLLFEHLAIAYQIIMRYGVVLDLFCLGSITPVQKKGKPATEPSSYRPITISSVFCKLFELLIIGGIRKCCKAPPLLFGFQSGRQCTHALHFVANVLLDAHVSSKLLAIIEYDVCHSFDLGIYVQIMLEVRKNGANPAIV
jgi:hypothetical protein